MNDIANPTIILLMALGDTLIVAGALLVLPLVSRRGMLFGAYVGEEIDQTNEAKAIRKRWYRTMWIVIAGALLATFLAWLIVQQIIVLLAGNIIIVAGFFVAYLAAHQEARQIAAPQPRSTLAAASLVPDDSPVDGALIWITLMFGLSAGLLAIIVAWRAWPALPDKIPTHFGLTGEPDAWSEKSIASVFLLPALIVIMTIIMTFALWMISHAKRTIRAGDHGTSLEAQRRFRTAILVFIAGIANVSIAMLLALSISTVRVALGEDQRLSPAVMILGVLMLLVGLVGAIVLAFHFGQGGARLEEREEPTHPLTGALADDRYWKLGLFYVNPDDPTFAIENRFGLGYTINFGNRKAAASLIIMFLFIVAVLIAALLAS